MTATNGAGHLDANDLAGYVEGRLDAAARDRVELHLADCASCRADALAALRARSRPGINWRLAAPLLAAAVIAIVVLPRAWRESGRVDTERSGVPAVAVVLAAPDTGAALPVADVPLVWRSVAAGADYRVTVTTEDGVRVFTGSTRDTVVTVPAASLRPATRYLWMVDVVLADGTVLASTARGFAIRR